MFVDVTSKENKYKNSKITEQERNRTYQHKIGCATDDDNLRGNSRGNTFVRSHCRFTINHLYTIPTIVVGIL
jgi:hypothetical protein